MLIYIAGPITGKPNENIEAFQAAKREMVRRYPSARVIIPHNLYTPDRSAKICPALCWTEAMAECLPVVDEADLVVALPGWRESRGARREIARAKKWIEL